MDCALSSRSPIASRSATDAEITRSCAPALSAPNRMANSPRIKAARPFASRCASPCATEWRAKALWYSYVRASMVFSALRAASPSELWIRSKYSFERSASRPSIAARAAIAIRADRSMFASRPSRLVRLRARAHRDSRWFGAERLCLLRPSPLRQVLASLRAELVLERDQVQRPVIRRPVAALGIEGLNVFPLPVVLDHERQRSL